MNDQTSANRWLWQSVVLFSVATFLSAKLGAVLSLSQTSYVSFWLPAGLYVGVLLLNETRHWPWFVLGAVVANISFDFSIGTPLSATLGFCLADTVEAVTGAYLARRFVTYWPCLDTLKEFFGLMLCTAVLGPMLGAAIGAATLTMCSMSHSFTESWNTWWGNNLMAVFLLVPLLLVSFNRKETEVAAYKSPGKLLEAVLLTLTLIVFTWYMLVVDMGINAPYKSRLMPVLLWAGLRFGLRGATWANLLFALLMAFFTTHYLKGLSAAEIASGSFTTTLQSFVAMSVLVALVPTIVINDRNRKVEALRESEEKFSKAFQTSYSGIVICDLDTGSYMEVNESFAQIYGYSREEMLGKTTLSLGIFKSASERDRIVGPLVAGGSVRDLEMVTYHRDNVPKTVLVNAEKIEVDGKPCVVSMVHDITARKDAEAALRLSDFSVNQASFATLWIASDARVVRANHAACAQLGYTEAEMLQLTVHDFNPDFPPERWQVYWKELGEQRHMRFESRNRHKDGHVFPVELDLNRFEFGGKEYNFAFVSDISERKRAEETHARLATVVEQATEMILITDTRGKIIYVNPALERITGYTRDEILGQNPRILKSGRHDDDYYREMWNTLKSGQVWRGHFTNRRKDASLYEVEATISPVRDDTNQIINYVGVNRDVSREVQLEAELRQSQKMEAIGQLAGGVAHDFNNILSAMRIQTELMGLIADLPGEVHEGLRAILKDVTRAADLTQQLLLFSRRQVMQTRPLDLNEVVTNLAKMLQRIIGEDVQLQLRPHPAPLHTVADPGMLEQVLMNLVVNARDAMTRGGLLRIETTEKIVDEDVILSNPDACPGRYVCVSVGDTGGGISLDVLPRIFEPFFTTKEVGKGTGLGLATVFGIVKQHQGWIKVDNHPGTGVTFHIFLPASSVKVVEEEQPAPKAKARGGTETILLVEDELMLRKLTRMMLERNGYQILEVSTGVEALECWKNNREKVALLLTDLVMPGGVSGQELARQLQTENPALKVIFTSGYSANIAGRDFHLRPSETFIQKPFEINNLLDIIRRSLEG